MIIDQVVSETKMPLPEQVDDPAFHIQAIITTCNGSFSQRITALLKVISGFESSYHVKSAIDTFGKIYCHLFPEPQDGIKNKHLNELKQILHDVEFDIEQVRRAFDQSVERKVCRPAATINPDPKVQASFWLSEFRALLWILATKLTPNSERMPLVSFLHELITIQPSLSIPITMWLEMVAHDVPDVEQGLKSEASSRPVIPVEQPCLQVVITIPDKSKPASIRMEGALWLNRSSRIPSQVFEAHEDVLLKNISRTIEPWVETSVVKVGEHKLTIEVFLPLNLFKHHAIEHWKMSGLGGRFGEEYAMVVRSYDRILERRRRQTLVHDWETKWKQLLDLDQTTSLPKDVMVWIHSCDLSAIDRHCGAMTTGLGVALLVQKKVWALKSQQGKEFINHLVLSGIPLALWVREATDDESWAAIEQELRLMLENTHPTNLATCLYEKRRTDINSIWWRIALLWDDPTRIPPFGTIQLPGTKTNRRA